jgi:methyltransferase family protein
MFARLFKHDNDATPKSGGSPRPRQHFLARAAMKYPRLVEQMDWLWRGYIRNQEWPAPDVVEEPSDSSNPLRTYFESHKEGRGIWKWLHYFEIYDRHFAKFRGRETHALEIGIYSGGSLSMWKDYFGAKSRIYGVDIEESCKAYEDDATKVFIGNQADREFWKRFREQVPTLDIVIDDGGHEPNQQVVTLEELLPHLRPGGVFLCEDVCGTFNRFTSYINGVIHNLNASHSMTSDMIDTDRRLTCQATGFQSVIHSIHCYPFVTVIEKRKIPLAEFIAPKHGTQWQPFLK